jgi:MFS family permease
MYYLNRKNEYDNSIVKIYDYFKNTFTSKKLLVFFFFCNFFIYFDRGSIGSTIIFIESTLNINSLQSGCIGASFMLGYMCLSPFFANLEKSYKSTWIMAFGLFLFCIAAFGCSVSMTFLTLLISRIIIGVSEASYTSLATAYVDTIAPKNSKSTWLAIYFLAMALGAAGGYSVSGFLTSLNPIFNIVEDGGTWRYSFIIESFFMLPLSICCIFLPEPNEIKGRTILSISDSHNNNDYSSNDDSNDKTIVKKIEEDENDNNVLFLSNNFINSDKKNNNFQENLIILLKNKVYMFITFGNSSLNFITGALTFWVPTLIFEEIDIKLEYATLLIGVITFSAGVTGTLCGGKFIDYISGSDKHKNIRKTLLTLIIIFIIKLPFLFTASISTNLYIFFISFLISEILFFFTLTPINGLIMKVVDKDDKIFAISFQIFLSHLLGDFPSPFIIGLLRQYFGIRISMIMLSFMVIPVIIFFSLAYVNYIKNK